MASIYGWLRERGRPGLRALVLAVVLGELSGIVLVLQTGLMAWMVDRLAFRGARPDALGLPLAALLLAIAARVPLSWGSRMAAQAGSRAVKRRVRASVVAALREAGPARLAELRTGGIAASAMEAVEALDGYFSRFLPQRAIAALLPFTVLAVVFPLDWISGLILVSTAVFLPLSMILVGEETHSRYQRQWSALSRLSGRFLDSLQGLSALKSFGAERAEADRIERASDEYRKATMSVLKVAFLSSFMLELVSAVSIAIVAVVSGFRLLSGSMGFAPAYFVLLVAPEYFLTLRNLGAQYHARMDAASAAERIRDLLESLADAPTRDRPRTVDDAGGAARDPAGRGGGSARRRGGVGVVRHRDLRAPGPPAPCAVTFERVTCSYPPRAAFERLSFSIGAGERVAMIGPSGAGKSTVIAAVLGFVPPSEGRILVDGRDLSAIPRGEWLARVAWLPQRPTVFAGSLRENIRLGRASASDAEVEEAARLARVEDLARATPDGLDGKVGEGGRGLSSGQIQRLALARLFLRSPDLVLLDEPTAHQDPESDRLLQEGIAVLVAGRTAIIATHRATDHADRVLSIAACLGEAGT